MDEDLIENDDEMEINDDIAEDKEDDIAEDKDVDIKAEDLSVTSQGSSMLGMLINKFGFSNIQEYQVKI